MYDLLSVMHSFPCWYQVTLGGIKYSYPFTDVKRPNNTSKESVIQSVSNMSNLPCQDRFLWPIDSFLLIKTTRIE